MRWREGYAWTIAQVKIIAKDETYIGHTIHYRRNEHFPCESGGHASPKVNGCGGEHAGADYQRAGFSGGDATDIAKPPQKCKMVQCLFSGLVRRADCGRSPSHVGRTGRTCYGHYHCSKYVRAHANAPAHYIRYDVLMPVSLPSAILVTGTAREERP